MTVAKTKTCILMTNIVHYCDANTQALYCIVKQTQLLTKNTGYYTLSTIPIHSTSPSPLIAPHLPTVLPQGVDKRVGVPPPRSWLTL